MRIRKTDVTIVIIMAVLAAGLYGCAALTAPTTREIIDHPLGTESIKIGMTKQQVESIWGKPNDVRIVEDKDKWKGAREMWIYYAQYGAIPVDAGYLSQTKKLYFDGVNLTEIGG